MMSSSSTVVICSNVPKDITSSETKTSSKIGLWKVLQRATNARRLKKTTSSSKTDDEDDTLTVGSHSDTSEVSSISEDDEEQEKLSLPLRSCLSPSSSTEEKVKKSVQLNRHGRVKYTLHLNQFTQEEISSTWYNQTELCTIKSDYAKERKRQALLGRVSGL